MEISPGGRGLGMATSRVKLYGERNVARRPRRIALKRENVACACDAHAMGDYERQTNANADVVIVIC